VVAASDYMKILPDGIAKWLPNGLTSLGTDGFGRSESREALRDFFEVDARFITLATLTALMNRGEVSADVVKKAVKALKIAPNKLNPMHS
jgi:pyruvate dehydrogenase E1 component